MPYKITNISRDPVSINSPQSKEDDLYLKPNESGVVPNLPIIPAHLRSLVVEGTPGADIESTIHSTLSSILPKQVDGLLDSKLAVQSVSNREYTDDATAAVLAAQSVANAARDIAISTSAPA